MTFSIIHHRLFRVVDEAVITLKNVSGSAVTNEAHDLMASLYRADGSLLMGGFGYLHHLTSAAEACKAIIRRFRDDVHEGDVFLLNDPYTAALHTSDVYLIAPIHYCGELVAWSSCFVHVYDIGAVNPGGFCPDADSIYTEGFSSPGLRLVDRGEMKQDILDTLLNMVRNPEMVTLDLKSMIACNNTARDRMLALIEKYGYESVDEVGLTLIEQSEQKLRARLRELPDGQWQARQYLSVKDEVSKVTLKMLKQDDRLTFDFSGSSRQSRYSLNCNYWATLGGTFAPVLPLLCYDITWNEGIIRPIELIAPEGTIVNCTRPAPVSVATVGVIQSVNCAVNLTISKMLDASDEYKKEATAVWHSNHFAIVMFGRNQYGRESIGVVTEGFGGSGGARSFADGVDVGGDISNPISRMSNVETTENTFPVRYLFRRRQIDSAGAGRFRGGTGMEFAVVPHDAPDGGLHYVISGKGTQFAMGDGLSGGLPGALNSCLWVHNNEAADSNAFALRLEDMPGDAEPVEWGVYPLMGEDALYVRWDGGGGYGDPLNRPAEDVCQDLRDGVVSERCAQEIYGVIPSADGNAVDVDATSRMRTELLDERKTVVG